jgi:hypothetical protein
MPRRATGSESRSRRARRGSTEGSAARPPRRFVLTLIALAATAIAATCAAIRVLESGPAGDLLRQYRLIADPPWSSAEEAIQSALANDARADAMMAGLRALATAEPVLSGRTEARTVPVDAEAMYRADWNNEVTRLSAAVLAAAREQAVGGDAGRQYEAFERVISSPNADACTTYALEWRQAWARCLDRIGLGRAGCKAGLQGAVTPSKWIASVPISALPRVAERGARLAADLESAGRPRDADRVRREVARTLRRLMEGDGSAANVLLCADLIVRHGLYEPGRAAEAAAQRDGIRSAVHGMAIHLVDLFDATRTPPPPGTERPYRALQAAALAAMSLMAMTIGSALASAIGVLRVVVAGARAAAEPIVDAPRSGGGTTILVAGACAAAAVVLSWARSRWGETPIDTWVVLNVVALGAAGFVAAALVSRPPRTRGAGAGRVALLIGLLACPLLSNHAVALAERFARSHAAGALFAAVLLVAAAGAIWFVTRIGGSPAAICRQRASIRGLIAFNVFAVASLAGSIWVLVRDAPYRAAACRSSVDEMNVWFDPAARAKLIGDLGVMTASTRPS